MWNLEGATIVQRAISSPKCFFFFIFEWAFPRSYLHLFEFFYTNRRYEAGSAHANSLLNLNRKLVKWEKRQRRKTYSSSSVLCETICIADSFLSLLKTKWERERRKDRSVRALCCPRYAHTSNKIVRGTSAQKLRVCARVCVCVSASQHSNSSSKWPPTCNPKSAARSV